MEVASTQSDAVREELNRLLNKAYDFRHAAMCNNLPDSYSIPLKVLGLLRVGVCHMLARLKNATSHLVRSNKELKHLIEENGPDADFKAAIEENIVTIAKYRSMIEGLKKQLEQMGIPLQTFGSSEADVESQQESTQINNQQAAPGSESAVSMDQDNSQDGTMLTDVGLNEDGNGMWV